MEGLEKISSKRRKRQRLQKTILSTVAAVGMLSVAMVVPNVVRLLGRSIVDRTSIYRTRRRLVEAGMLAKDQRGYLRLTPRGEEKLRQLERANYKLKKPKRWDSRWRLLIFDIGEKRKNIRDKLRTTLVSVGFYRLQDSVWVYPYDCEDFVMLLKADFKVGKDVLYIIADVIENDMELRRHFTLPVKS